MKSTFQVSIGILVVTGLLLSACALPASTRPGLELNLIYPRSGQVVGLPAADVFVYAEAFAPDGGINRIIFYADGLVIGEDTSPVNQGQFSLGTMHWFPTDPGEYLVQAEAFRSDGSVFSDAARICVLPVAGPDPAPYYFGYGYTGPCELPAANPEAPEGMAVSMVAHAIPASLAYDFECPGGFVTATIAFEAVVDDPSDRVVFVAVEYSIPDRGAAGSVAADSVGLNWTSSSATGEKIFTGTTVDFTQSLRDQFAGEGGLVTWTARAIDRVGNVVAQDGPNDIPATPCIAAVIGIPMPVVLESTATITPFPTETATPTLVPVVPTKKSGGGGGGGGGCGSHGDKDSCSAAGCTWDVDKKSCS